VKFVLFVLAACHASSPPPPPVAETPKPIEGPRCIAAGGRCVGPAAIAAHPSAPCPAGMHRVDDVLPRGPMPACYGIPHGEEACCMPDPALPSTP